MPAGIEIINDYGTVLIDSTYTNMSLLQSGIATSYESSIDAEVSVGIASLPVGAGPGQYLAIHCTQMAGLWAGNYAYAPVGAQVHWYLFGPPPNSTSANVGLAIYKGTGDLAFHSALKYARVRDSFTQTSGNFTKTYDTGRKYAVIWARRGANVRRELIFDPDTSQSFFSLFYDGSAARMDGANIIFGWQPYASRLGKYGPVGNAWESKEMTAHIIDVTGY